MNKCAYNYFTHKHNFAVWAAARAAQRGWKGGTVDKLQGALEHSGVVEFLRRPTSLNTSQKRFDRRHAQWCRSIIEYLSSEGVRDATFGRAAKLIAVYLKVMVIIGLGAESKLSKVVHPPIDAILLKNLAGAAKVRSLHGKEWHNIKWTKLTETEYCSLIAQLREHLEEGEPMWHLERYWTITND